MQNQSELSKYLSAFLPSITVLTGAAAGTEFFLDQAEVKIGRGPGVDLAFEDSTMSSVHAVIEFSPGGFAIRRLNGASVHLNGGEVDGGALKDGDHFGLGAHRFEFTEIERTQAGRPRRRRNAAVS